MKLEVIFYTPHSMYVCMEISAYLGDIHLVNHTVNSQMYDQYHVELHSTVTDSRLLEYQRHLVEDGIDCRLFFFSCVVGLALLHVASAKETTIHQEIELR